MIHTNLRLNNLIIHCKFSNKRCPVTIQRQIVNFICISYSNNDFNRIIKDNCCAKSITYQFWYGFDKFKILNKLNPTPHTRISKYFH